MRPGHPARVDLDVRRAHVGSTGDPMTRNPQLPIGAVTEPIKVALLTDDPLLRAGLSSLLEKLGSIDVVERDAAEVALWDAGVDGNKTLGRLADRLGISDHTAKFHVNGVMMKLGASTRTEAVVEAMRRGLIRL